MVQVIEKKYSCRGLNTCVYNIVGIMVVDVLVTQGASASAAKVLAQLS